MAVQDISADANSTFSAVVAGRRSVTVCTADQQAQNNQNLWPIPSNAARRACLACTWRPLDGEGVSGSVDRDAGSARSLASLLKLRDDTAKIEVVHAPFVLGVQDITAERLFPPSVAS